MRNTFVIFLFISLFCGAPHAKTWLAELDDQVVDKAGDGTWTNFGQDFGADEPGNVRNSIQEYLDRMKQAQQIKQESGTILKTENTHTDRYTDTQGLEQGWNYG
jgi:hypothetical protein